MMYTNFVELLLPDASNLVSKSLDFCFWEEIVLKVFAIYSYGGHLSHVTWVIYANVRSPFLRMLRKQFNFGLPFGFRGDNMETVDGRRRTDDGGMVIL